MTRVDPIAVAERKAAAMLDMKPAEFRKLVASGSLPQPLLIGKEERWRVDDLRAIVSGEAARPPGQGFKI